MSPVEKSGSDTERMVTEPKTIEAIYSSSSPRPRSSTELWMGPEAGPLVTTDPQTMASPDSLEEIQEEIADWAGLLDCHRSVLVSLQPYCGSPLGFHFRVW